MEEFRSYQITIVILVILNMFLGVLVGLTCDYWSKEKPSYPVAEGIFCLPCSEVLGHPDDGIPEGITASENGTKCCAKDNANLTSLIEAYTNNWHEKKLHEENPSYSKCREEASEDKPLIKLVIADGPTQGWTETVEWEQTLSRSSELPYAGGHVTILKTGLYFVYSQVVFQFDPLTTEHPELPKQHIISLRQVGSPAEEYTPIAKGSNSQCKFQGQSAGQKHNSTSFIATLYQLHKGDRVSVRVYDRRQIIPNKHMNIFGLHMV